jgi:hypothetical protein
VTADCLFSKVERLRDFCGLPPHRHQAQNSGLPGCQARPCSKSANIRPCQLLKALRGEVGRRTEKETTGSGQARSAPGRPKDNDPPTSDGIVSRRASYLSASSSDPIHQSFERSPGFCPRTRLGWSSPEQGWCKVLVRERIPTIPRRLPWRKDGLPGFMGPVRRRGEAAAPRTFSGRLIVETTQSVRTASGVFTRRLRQ